MTDEAKQTPSTPKLSDKQKAFVEAYLISWNATQAAIEAGYSEKSARQVGSDTLSKAYIRAYVDRRLSEMVMSADEVLKRLSDMAKVSLLPFIEITPEGFVYFDFSHPDAKNYMHLIKKIKSKRTRRLEGALEWEDELVEVELHDAFAALVQVGKHHKLFTDNVDLTSGGKALQPPQFIEVIKTYKEPDADE